MPPPTVGEPLRGEPVAEPARLRDVDAEESAGVACEEKGEQAPGIGGVAGDDGARHLAAAEGTQRRVAGEAALIADDREAPRAGERRDELARSMPVAARSRAAMASVSSGSAQATPSGAATEAAVPCCCTIRYVSTKPSFS